MFPNVLPNDNEPASCGWLFQNASDIFFLHEIHLQTGSRLNWLNNAIAISYLGYAWYEIILIVLF